MTMRVPSAAMEAMTRSTSAVAPGSRLAVGSSRKRISGLSAHNLGQARRLADEIVFNHAGRAAERTAADRFFDQPASNEARLFLQGELPWK